MARLLVNPPCEVWFAGWRSNTYDLGKAGWEISFERADDPYFRMTVEHMLLWHRGSGLKGMASCTEAFDTYRWRFDGGNPNRLPTFVVKQWRRTSLSGMKKELFHLQDSNRGP